jgi:hypothetical protein
MNKESLIQALIARGWKLDRFGHVQKDIGGKKYRVKILMAWSAH